ncbi:MAG: right-handed parallel beta-helix repeat-containing protein, partial [Verrucomicrobiota bacterium]|nr:right-handed parallel beta-helix repeat-containing protein [Verrucomicrobiota bacterium]
MRFDRTSRMLLMAETMLFSSMCFGAGTFHVDHGFRGESPTGASWLSAFPTLQGAIDAAADAGGGEVWVKAGVHKPEGGSRNATIELKPGVELYGGFRGFETERDQRNPKANRTVLSGDIGRSGSPDNCYHVLTGASNARIDGFIISRGNANAAGVNRFGGGLILPAGSQNTTVANCTFEKNHAESGGGIHAQDATFAATNCTFYSNSAQAGGAVALARGARLGAVDCIFSSNFAPIAGGAVFLPTDSNATFTRSTFLYTSTDGSGGAIHAETDKEAGLGLELHHSTFRENSAELNGGALAL